METNFIQNFKNQIIDKLNDYSGTTIYACDLSFTLFQGENANGSVFYNTYKTKEFIKDNFDLFGDLVEYCKDNMDMNLNPFSEPEKAHVILLVLASQSILSKLPTIDKEWNNEIELTPKMIKKITKELLSIEIEDEDLF
jgi:cyclophilin family peptidyl-prolyl cis-trans isomerase